MKLNPMFTSHMVFAAGKPIRVWGEGCGTVSASFAGQTITAEADGRWELSFPAMICGGPYEMRLSLNGEEITLTDVWVGEVYLFSGQSNMQFKLYESNYPREKWEDEPRARMFATERIEKNEHFHPEDGWRTCIASEAGDWSAIAYHFCLKIARKKNIAVGAVFCYQGASIIESWVPAGTFIKAGLHDIPTPTLHANMNPLYKAWNGDGMLYEYALAQVIPFAFTGVLWYQGESDSVETECALYDRELALMIDIWRKDFRDAELPFLIIQIADYETRPDKRWKAVQAAQIRVEQLRRGVKTVLCADICESDNIHPPTKDPLAFRAAEAMGKMV